MKENSNKNWFARHKVLSIILGIILLFIIIGIAGGGSSSPRVTNSTEQGTDTPTQQKTEFTIGETVSVDERELTVTEVQRNYQTGNQFAQAETNNEFVIVTIKLKNNSGDAITYNTFDFKIQDANGVQKSEDFMVLSEGKLNSGSLAPGGMVTGKIGYQVPKDDPNLKLIYSGGLFSQPVSVKL